jgi:hypothetical protein
MLSSRLPGRHARRVTSVNPAPAATWSACATPTTSLGVETRSTTPAEAPD